MYIFILIQLEINFAICFNVYNLVLLWVCIFQNFKLLLYCLQGDLKRLTFKERNPLLSRRWRLLSESERENFNERVKNKHIVDDSVLTKRILRNIDRQVYVTNMYMLQIFNKLSVPVSNDDALSCVNIPFFLGMVIFKKK